MRNLVAACALVLTLTVIPSLVAGGDIQTDGKFVSTESTNPPLEVSSTAMVSNLNADLVDGYNASQFVKVIQTAMAFSPAQQIYFSGSDGKLPDNVVDDGSIEDVTRRVFFGCNQLDPGYFPNGPSMSWLGLTPALVFGNVTGENQRGITLSTLVPDDWDGTSGFEIYVFWAANNVAGKDVLWYVGSSAIADDEDLTTGSYAFYGVLKGFGSTTQFGRVRSGPVTIEAVNLARGDLLSIWIKRDGDDDRDTLDVDAYLVGVEISYVAVR